MRRFRLALLIAGLALATTTFLPSVAASAAPSVPGLYACGSAPGCHYGPVYDLFPNYNSVCSSEDCFFVSAANWEQVATGVVPSVSQLKSDYVASGQPFSGGRAVQDLWSYWTTSGIDGEYLVRVTTIGLNKLSVEFGVLHHRALIVRVATARASYIGTEKVGAGTAIMIADGYTPKGPLVVFQGRTLQMTWPQWNAQARSAWEIFVTTTPRSSTTTPPPTPPSATVPTASLALSSTYVPSSGATVTLTFSSQNATNCSLSSSPSIWTAGSVVVPCNGTYQINVVPSSSQQQWVLTFTASSAGGPSAISSQTLTQEAPATPVGNASLNWSGYFVPSSSAIITDVEGDWTVPTLNCADTPNGYSTIWVGIGGQQSATGGSSGALLQTGTNANCVNGVQQNSGWWELVPANPNNEQVFTSFPVAPGDQIQASVFQTTTGAWQTEVTDLTTGLSAYMITGGSWGVGRTSAGTFTVQGSAVNISYSGGYTAEWIVEDPENAATQTLFSFANFGSVTFSNLRSSFTTWSLTPSQMWAIVQNGVTLATPTATTTDGFTDTYTGP